MSARGPIGIPLIPAPGARARRVLPRSLAIALLVAACGGAAPTAAPTVGPTPSPAITPAPTPTPKPTPTPRPTFTFDDQEIEKIIKTSAAEVSVRLDLTGKDTNAEIAQVFKDLRSWADSQQTRISVFTPSPCTQRAVDKFNDGMDGLQNMATAFLDWMAGGAVGDPGTDPMAQTAGADIRQALDSLAASC